MQALAYSALKARAARIAPNQILRSGDFELIVEDDEKGAGLVVQMMLQRADLEALACSHAAALEPASEHWSEGERREFLGGIFAELARYLDRWQGIAMRRGDGRGCDCRDGCEQVIDLKEIMMAQCLARGLAR